MREVFPKATFLMVEANEHHNSSWSRAGLLNDRRIHGEFAILGSDPVPVEWWPTRGGTGDSLFPENTGHRLRAQPKYRSAETLDSLVARSLPGRTFELVKLDVQGAELSVLRGGKGLLARGTEVITMEVPLAGSYNAGAPSFAQCISYLDSIGYMPMDVPEYHRIVNKPARTSYMVQVDVIFVHKNTSLLQGVQQLLASFGARGHNHLASSMQTGQTYTAM